MFDFVSFRRFRKTFIPVSELSGSSAESSISENFWQLPENMRCRQLPVCLKYLHCISALMHFQCFSVHFSCGHACAFKCCYVSLAESISNCCLPMAGSGVFLYSHKDVWASISASWLQWGEKNYGIACSTFYFLFSQTVCLKNCPVWLFGSFFLTKVLREGLL